jgi:hypothetical protein
MKPHLWLKSLTVLGLVLILSSCSTNSDGGIAPSDSSITDTDNTSVERIIPGKTECDNAGEVSPDGKYVCAGRGAFYWVSLLDLATNTGEDLNDNSGGNANDNSKNGYWTTNCVNVEVPNPNYNANKGFSAVVNEPTIRTQECSQIWIQK